MKLYSHKKLRLCKQWDKYIYFQHTDGKRTCYHYDVKGTGASLEAIKAGGKPVDTMGEGFGCES